MAQLVVEDTGPVAPDQRLYASPDDRRNVPAQPPPPPQPTTSSPAPPAPTVDPYAKYFKPVDDHTPAGQPTGVPSAPISVPDEHYAQFFKPVEDEPTKAPYREVGGGEAIGRGALHGITMGLAPAMEGVSAAAEPDIEAAAKKFGIDPEKAKFFIDHLMPGLKTMYGAGRLAYDKATAEGETPATKAYGETRAHEAEANTEAGKQHPVLYTGADLAASLAVPLPGLGAIRTGANIGRRIATGVGEGVIAGGGFGAGNAIGEGKSAPEVLKDTAKGAALGGFGGGVISGAVGARVPTNTIYDRAAHTAEHVLEAPLPRGVTSNSPAIREITGKAAEIPVAGPRIGGKVRRTLAAAGEHVNEMATNMVGGAPTRTTAAPHMAPAVRQAIEHNNGEIDRAYDALRHELNPDQHFPMPHLRRAIRDVELRRSRAGWQNPGLGLEQARNVANATGHAGGFNGVHRLRRDLREAGNPTKANPGYDAGDFRHLTRAIAEDLRRGVRHVSTNPNRAESLFNTAELTAGRHIQMNEQLEQLAGQKGEAIVTALLNSTKAKNGNIALLQELRRSMSPAAFEQVSGVMLHELGLAEGQPGQFSISHFSTSWNKVSDQAKAIMFSPAHRAAIDELANVGEVLKESSKYLNNSHTGGVILAFDLAKDAALLATDLARNGELGYGAAVGIGSTAAGMLFTTWLGNSRTAMPLARWVRSYTGLANQPTPARVAAFKVATRNLANNVNLPYDRIMSVVQRHLPAVSAPPQVVPNEKQLGGKQAPGK